MTWWWPMLLLSVRNKSLPVFYTDMESVNIHVSVHSIGTASGQNPQGTLSLMCAIPDDLMLTDGSRALTLGSVRNRSLLVNHNDMQSVNVHVTGHSIGPPTENSSDRQGNGWHSRHRYHHWLSGHWMVHRSQCNRLALKWVLSYIYTDSTMKYKRKYLRGKSETWQLMRLQRSSQLTWCTPGKAVAEPISDSRVSQIIINCKCLSCPVYSWTKRVNLCIVSIPVQTSTDDFFSSECSYTSQWLFVSKQ